MEMDSIGEEVSLWQKMMQYPDSWAEGTLPLRSTMGKEKGKWGLHTQQQPGPLEIKTLKWEESVESETNIWLWIHFILHDYCDRPAPLRWIDSADWLYADTLWWTVNICSHLYAVYLQRGSNWPQTNITVENMPKHHNTKRWIYFRSTVTVIVCF